MQQGVNQVHLGLDRMRCHHGDDSAGCYAEELTREAIVLDV